MTNSRRTRRANVSCMVLLSALTFAACPRSGGEPPETSGSAVIEDGRPADLGLSSAERRALRGKIERKLAVMGAQGEGESEAASTRLRGALDVLESLDDVANSKGASREQEREALAVLSTWFDSSIESADQSEVSVPEPGPWERAVAAYAAGDFGQAVDDGLAALTGLVDAGVDSATLRYRLAEWAVESGDATLAAELFEGAVTVEAGQGWIAEDGLQQAARARNVGLGPEGAALAEARAMVAQGRWGAAHGILMDLVEQGEDAALQEEARRLTTEVIDEAELEAIQKMARAEQILEGNGPYQVARELLQAIKLLPPGTWSDAEHLRLEGWYRNRVGVTTEAERRAQQAEQDAILANARALVVAGDVRDALLLFAQLDGTPLRSTARKESREASETWVRSERERAGGLFVAARKLRDQVEKRSALEEVERIINVLIDEFPDSDYVERLRTNLTAVQDELLAL